MNELLTKLDIFTSGLWVEDGRWLMPPVPWMFFSHWHATDSFKKILPDAAMHSIFSVNGYAFWYKKDRAEIYAYLKKRNEQGTLHDLVDVIDAEGNAISKKLLNELEHDDAYIQKSIVHIFSIYDELIGVWMTTGIGDQVVPLAKDIGYVSSEAELFARVHPHLRSTWIEDEVCAVVEVAFEFIRIYPVESTEDRAALQRKLPELIEKNGDLNMRVEKYMREFAWCSISKWIGEPVGRAYAYKRVLEEVVNCRERNHIETHRSNKAGKNVDGLIAISACSAYWRAQCARMEMILSLRMRPILNMVGEKNGWDYKKVLLLTPRELILAVESPSMIVENKEKILAREKEFFTTGGDNGLEVILTPADPDYALIQKLYLKRADPAAARRGVLKGIGACPGKIRGRVRIISSAKDFGSFKEGEILVASETSPTFVPLMRMSAAIVTGKGGITSHAAIVSRELKKPCVIAVRDVTSILKDGDLIEVDADNGTVRIVG